MIEKPVQLITENPYCQYFLWLPGFQDKPPFYHSLMTHFRKGLGADVVTQINEWILVEEEAREKEDDKNDPPGPSKKDNISHAHSGQPCDEQLKNKGTLMLDATCAPADISYPTDLKLLNGPREKLEAIIDVLHAPFIGEAKKPRTYRHTARKRYLEIAKKRRAGAKVVRKAIGKQLRYVSRNLSYYKQHGIRLSGPSLGRPKKEAEQDRNQARQDASARNAIEGRFGEGKRSYGLGRIRARLRETSETVIALQLLS